MTPIEIFTIGKGLWELYETIIEDDGNKKPETNEQDRNTNDPPGSWSYFGIDEFRCPCCNRNHISNDLVNRLDRARKLAGVPFRINSGYRCKSYNSSPRIGGKPRSAHLKGFAVDIHAPTGSLKGVILPSLYAVGIKRVGLYKTFIHADIDDNLPKPMVFGEGI